MYELWRQLHHCFLSTFFIITSKPKWIFKYPLVIILLLGKTIIDPIKVVNSELIEQHL